MCGICGKLAFEPGATISGASLKTMADAIRHRGPDDEGYYISGSVGLGFRRLAIIDLQTGHQPLCNEDGSVWIVFNGEIYNYQELRGQLVEKGHVFKTQTDTEVIVHLYEEFGAQCLEKLRGMFAFAIWNRNTKTLLLARDRVGIKPLYYSLTEASLVFASEIKSILTDPSVRKKIAPEFIDRFLTFLYLPGEQTLLDGVQKLEPGHYLEVKEGKASVHRYWDLEFRDTSSGASLADKENELQALFSDTVRLHMIADVPVGVLLSGGVDSTGVLSAAINATDKRISTFTVGFDGEGVADERPYARLAAQEFGTDHHEITITAKDFASFLPQYVWHMEEPVCEPPAIALYYITKLARKHVKVLLSGEGGDEAFAGYSNYRHVVWLERLKHAFHPLNSTLARGASIANYFLKHDGIANYSPLMTESFPDYYYSRTSNPYRYSGNGLGKVYSEQFAQAIDKRRTLEPIRRHQSLVRHTDALHAMLYIDTKTWLPDDLLIKADKMTMANSVELRVPLLDHKVLEFAASVPPSYKLRGTNSKYILKRALSKNIPAKVQKRKKAGFPVPYASWLRHDLQDLAWDLLTDRKAIERGYFRKEGIENLLRLNSEGIDYSKEIFSLITLELWQRIFLDCEEVVL